MICAIDSERYLIRFPTVGEVDQVRALTWNPREPYYPYLIGILALDPDAVTALDRHTVSMWQYRNDYTELIFTPIPVHNLAEKYAFLPVFVPLTQDGVENMQEYQDIKDGTTIYLGGLKDGTERVPFERFPIETEQPFAITDTPVGKHYKIAMLKLSFGFVPLRPLVNNVSYEELFNY